MIYFKIIKEEQKMEQLVEKFKLVRPTIEYKEKALEYIKELYSYNSSINGVGGLSRYLENYEDWLEKLEDDRNKQVTEDTVPAETYFLVRKNDDKVIGMINIRLELNEKLRNTYGHIGYSIRPTERRKGYNKINLYLGLLECQKHNIDRVMITCDKTNLGSLKTILHFDPEFEREYYDDLYPGYHQVYWIDVDKAIKSKESEFEKYL